MVTKSPARPEDRTNAAPNGSIARPFVTGTVPRGIIRPDVHARFCAIVAKVDATFVACSSTTPALPPEDMIGGLLVDKGSRRPPLPPADGFEREVSAND